jgi:hypothetical protein
MGTMPNRATVNTITRGNVSLDTSDARPRESLLDFLMRKTRGHLAMCPCDACRFARIA